MAKTTIISQFKPEVNEEFGRVLPFSENDFAVLTYKSGKPKIQLFGSYKGEIDIPDPKKIVNLNFYTSFFYYKNGIGLADKFGTLILFESLNSKFKSVQLKHPHKGEQMPPLPFLSVIAYQEIDDCFVMGIEEPTSIFFPAKYWTKVKPDNRKILGFDFSKRKWTVDKLEGLDITKYPKTSRDFSEGEWLSIQTIGTDKNKILIHTNGGAVTRSKSGPDFEFSIISEFDHDCTFVKNHTIEKGVVFFTGSDAHFVLLTPNKKKLMIYNKNNFQLDFEISLTAKQNLGTAKPKDLYHINIWKDYLYIGGKDFLNICKLEF